MLAALSRAGPGVASTRSAPGGAGCSLVAGLRLERRKPRSQIGNFPAQLRDLSALVDELDGDAAQREPESFSAELGADSRQARLVVRGS